MKEHVSGRWFARIQAKPQNWFGCLRRHGLLSKRYMLYPSFSCNGRISKFFGPRNISRNHFVLAVHGFVTNFGTAPEILGKKSH